MSREIKFRGIRLDGKGTIYGFYRKNTFYGLLIDGKAEIYTKHFIGCFDNISHFDGLFEQVEVYSESLGQFTGLKDKNGKDIYEGDILLLENELGRKNIHKVFRVDGGLVINSHNDDFYKTDFTPFYEACADNQTKQYIEQCEIIGNVYENTELLKK